MAFSSAGRGMLLGLWAPFLSFPACFAHCHRKPSRFPLMRPPRAWLTSASQPLSLVPTSPISYLFSVREGKKCAQRIRPHCETHRTRSQRNYLWRDHGCKSVNPRKRLGHLLCLLVRLITLGGFLGVLGMNAVSQCRQKTLHA